MSRRTAPPTGWPPPDTAVLNGVPVQLGPLCEEIADRYFERFPGIRAYMDDTLNFVRQNGYTKTLFGRKTHFYPNISSAVEAVQDHLAGREPHVDPIGPRGLKEDEEPPS